MRTAGRPFFNVVHCHTVGCTGRLHPADVRRQPIDTIVVFRPSELFFPPRSVLQNKSGCCRQQRLALVQIGSQMSRRPLRRQLCPVKKKSGLETIFGEGVTSIIDWLIQVGCVRVCAE
jgi:hypothetical protein